ncbi:hypothetical protein TRAPUB_13400 [Trametes pubescens]|uniref:Uncharacterized protein n=1 Tax=Trametes pubescens TaxID=154538 RepID=A0A1M2V4G9_TRAPU|nr:hypothetical protein TRAPUB_6982 [Trametes pubescens]OJT10053.1 hypothetical protein TRAPUB_13409 [Trametes pubescens]OJT10110.1 hypothetical protein TRAPUB_13400 [Trametes pubescens]
MQAMLAVGFTPNGASDVHAVVLDAPQGQGQLVLARPAQANAWYAYEHAHIARILEETYGLTGDSFMKLEDALLCGVDGFMIPSRGDM